MNWDWDKLKEKQKTQQNWTPFNQKNNKSDENEQHERPQEPRNEKKPQGREDDSFQDFYDFYKKVRSQNNGNGGGNGNGDQPPNRNFENMQNAPKKFIKFALGAGAILWLLSGIYIVQPDEAGVVLRFGKYAYTTTPGPHYHLPYPIEQVYRPKVTQIRQAEVGFRSQSNSANFQQGRIQNVGDESAMLTGDENIVNIQFSIQYRIKPDAAVDYLFNVASPDAVLKNAAEAAMREVIGNNLIDAALTDGKIQIQNDVATLLQEILDRYKVGLEVVAVQMQDVQPPAEVGDAFKDVASAREDKSRIINESEAYRNEIIPIARGDAAEIVNQAEAYKNARVRNAEGEVSRFMAILDEYNKAPDITKQRLVYETLESILSQPGLEKIIITEEMQNMMPILPLSPQSSYSAPQVQNQTTISQTPNLGNAKASAQTPVRQNPYNTVR